jgi:hypothetical protein
MHEFRTWIDDIMRAPQHEAVAYVKTVDSILLFRVGGRERSRLANCMQPLEKTISRALPCSAFWTFRLSSIYLRNLPNMPIVGPPQITDNVSDWSHSTAFTTTLSTTVPNNVVPLITVWTPPADCVNRWMATPATVTIDSVTSIRTVAVVNDNTTSTLTHFFARMALPDEASPTTSDDLRTGFAPLSTTSESSRAPPLFATFVAFSTNPGTPTPGALFDPLYSSCQPGGPQSIYSPGICPEGQTVAEVTEYQHSGTSGIVETYYEASCCQRCVDIYLMYRVYIVVLRLNN